MSQEKEKANRAPRRHTPGQRLLLIAAGFLLAELLARGLVGVKRWLVDPLVLECDNPNAITCPYQPFQADQLRATASDPLTGTRWLPGVHGEWITINSLGFRGDEVRPHKPPDTLRVVMVGGSAVFGVGVHDDETIAALLETRLAGQLPQEVEVINAGLTGANSTQELIILETRVLALDPDMVIIYDGRNDLYFGLSPLWQPHYPPALQHQRDDMARTGERMSVGSLLGQAWALLGRYSMLVRVAQQATASLQARNAEQERLSMHPEALDVYRDNLRNMVTLLQAHNVRAVLVFQPLITAGDKPLTEAEQARQAFVEGRGFLEMLADTYPQGEEVVLEVGREFDVPAYSFTGVFDDVPETVYLDDVHCNTFGNEIIAGRLAEIILTEVLEER